MLYYTVESPQMIAASKIKLLNIKSLKTETLDPTGDCTKHFFLHTVYAEI